jgi:hypothetical protein
MRRFLSRDWWRPAPAVQRAAQIWAAAPAGEAGGADQRQEVLDAQHDDPRPLVGSVPGVRAYLEDLSCGRLGVLDCVRRTMYPRQIKKFLYLFFYGRRRFVRASETQGDEISSPLDLRARSGSSRSCGALTLAEEVTDRRLMGGGAFDAELPQGPTKTGRPGQVLPAVPLAHRATGLERLSIEQLQLQAQHHGPLDELALHGRR